MPAFTSQHQFLSRHQLDYVWSLIDPISSEQGLRSFERDTVENAIQKLTSAMNDIPLLRDHLGLRGTVTFESHTNLDRKDTNLSEPLERMSISRGSTGDAASASTASAPKVQRKTKGRGNRADHFCIYGLSDGTSIAKTAIEYKIPQQIDTGRGVDGFDVRDPAGS